MTNALTGVPGLGKVRLGAGRNRAVGRCLAPEYLADLVTVQPPDDEGNYRVTVRVTEPRTGRVATASRVVMLVRR